MSLTVESLDHLVVNVSDLERSIDWYQRVLGMVRQNAGGNPLGAALHFGRQKIHLRPVDISKEKWFTADHEAAGSDDLCFVVKSSPQEIIEHLRQCGVVIELGPVKRIGAQGEMLSIYCRDPDGSLIEISTYG